MIYSCGICRKLRKQLRHKNVELILEERILDGNPLPSFVRIDVFGPWEVITRKP